MDNRNNFIKSLLKITVLSAVFIYVIIETGQFLSSVRPLKISEVEITDTENLPGEIPEEVIKKEPVKKKKKKIVKDVIKNDEEKSDRIVQNDTEVKAPEDDIKEEKRDDVVYSFNVDQLKVIQLPEDKVIRMTFRLKNRSGVKVKGRFFIKFHRADDSYFFPETQLNDGIPAEIEKGVFYNIKRYKRVEVIIEKGIDLSLFSDVEFFIFEDSNGTVPVYRENHKLKVESGDIFKNPF